MRTHLQIIADWGGATKLRLAIEAAGVKLDEATTRSWARRGDGGGSIPPEYWPLFEQLGIASCDELNKAVIARKAPQVAEALARGAAA